MVYEKMKEEYCANQYHSIGELDKKEYQIIYKNVTVYVENIQVIDSKWNYITNIAPIPIVIGLCKQCYDIHRNNPLEIIE